MESTKQPANANNLAFVGPYLLITLNKWTKFPNKKEQSGCVDKKTESNFTLPTESFQL